jgi:pimeloyl-ACP methyl ester carboxylesterase
MSDRSLEYHRRGSGEPLLLLHGLGHTWRAWRGLLPHLETEFEVMAPDLPGFGGSPPLPPGTAPTPRALGDAIERELDALGWEAPHVAGNSLGGQLALELGRRGRARTAVAISPAGLWRGWENVWGRTALRATRALSFAPRPEFALRLAPVRVVTAGVMLGRPWRADPDELAEHVRRLRQATAFDTTRREIHRRRPEGLEEVRCPVLIVWGTRDRLTLPRQAERWVAAVPGAELRWLRDLGHLPMLEDPELVARIIADFLQRAAERAESTPKAEEPATGPELAREPTGAEGQ